MTPKLPSLIAQGEGSRLEFKSTISTAARIARTLCAFANTGGGTLLIGVDDDGKISGIVSEMHEMRKIEQATDFLVEPPLLVSYQIVTAEGKPVIVIDVPESAHKPHYAVDDGGKRTIYVRAKDKSVPTNKLILEQEPADRALFQSPNVKTLLQFLRKNEHITADRMAKLVNISDYRANKLLRQLTEQGLLLMIDKPRPARFTLKVN
ncbi:MAG: ATP-binding protein [Cytophagales bacterium]|nr:MAG: ATP-binding protein [Cytophagales bacterium]